MTVTLTADDRTAGASRGFDGLGWRERVLPGCPLRCPYCANPDTWHMRDGKEPAVEEVMAEIEKFRAFITTELTGGGLAPTLSFATRLDRLGVPMWIRYVLVPGWTDDEEAVEGLARFVAGLETVDRVDVLPFHKLGAAKYDALGLPFPLRDTPVPAPELTERVRARFRAHGLSAY